MNQTEKNLLTLDLKLKELNFQMVKFMLKHFPETKPQLKHLMLDVMDVSNESEKRKKKKSKSKPKNEENT